MKLILPIIIGLPILEIYVMIKVGGDIGALNTILLILLTAILGLYYAKIQGLNTLRSGLTQLVKNEIPVYEIISGAALAFAALLLIIPGFITDIIGFTLIFPFTRRLLFKNFTKNLNKKNKKNADLIDGEYEDIKED